ncbi:MAG: hypothetical protein H0U57_12960 [Tatlockia sp.]|nr:hypothetical protein [Tatlockia sp.]
MNKFQKRIQITLALITLVFFNSAFATNLFNVTSNGFDLTINTNTNNFYHSAGVKLQTPYYFLSPTSNCIFNYATGFCSFPVGKFAPAKISLLGNPGIVPLTLCLLANPFSAERPVSCQNYSVPVGSTQPPEPIPTPVITIPYAYVASQLSGEVSRCNLAADGSLTNCTPTVALLNTPFDVAVNQANTFAYVSTQPNIVLKCTVASDGAFSNCVSTGSGFVNPEGIALNSAGNIAYIVNAVNPFSYVSKCTIAANGDLISCTPTATGVFNLPQDITINPTGTMAYITDPNGGQIYRCDIAVNGDLTPCSVAAPFGGEFLAFKQAGDVAFVTTGTGVLSCEVSNIGNLVNCFTTGGPFTSTSGIAVNSAETLVYISDPNDNSVSTCEIDPNNFLINCMSSGNGLSYPVGIALTGGA